jgi:predicted acetyltransferase
MGDDGQAMRMVRPGHELYASFVDMAQEFRARGEQDWPHGASAGDRLALDDFPGYVRRVDQWARGESQPPGYVPDTTYWLVVAGRVVGTLNLRHELNEKLEYEGGHIGYCIRPADRGKGYMTGFLRMGLEEARNLGLTRVLITCTRSNAASAAVIRRCGGVLEDERPSRLHAGELTQRYWVGL